MDLQPRRHAVPRRDLYTNADRGWIGVRGVGDKTPFAGVPVLVKQGFMTPQQFYAIDPNT